MTTKRTTRNLPVSAIAAFWDTHDLTWDRNDIATASKPRRKKDRKRIVARNERPFILHDPGTPDDVILADLTENAS